MPTPKKGPRLGGSPAHQRLMLANLATSLFEHGAVTTTEAKARQLRPFAERLITKAKRGDLHNRRQVLSIIRDKGVVHVLFTEIGPKFAERPGGYTRITKVGPRKGDNAPMAVIELVAEEFPPEARSSKPTGTKAAAPAAVDDAQVEETPVEEPTTDEAAVEQPATDEAEDVEEPTSDADVDQAAEEVAEEPAQEAADEASTDDAPAEEAGAKDEDDTK